MVEGIMIKSTAGLDEGLRVRHIAAFPLTTYPDGDPDTILAKPEFQDFDQIPVKDGARIVGVLERSNPTQLRRLDDSLLVSADDLLSHFIHTVHKQPYRLVVDKTAIAGIVTWSDLLKLPVIVFAFSLVAELELAMNQRIKQRYGDTEKWLELVDDKKAVHKIAVRRQKLASQNLVLPVVELADLIDKAKVFRQILGTRRDFDADLESIRDLRNDVAHVKDIVRSEADLKRFVSRVDTAEVWLRIVKNSVLETTATV
jgi:PII-like signaling protein